MDAELKRAILYFFACISCVSGFYCFFAFFYRKTATKYTRETRRYHAFNVVAASVPVIFLAYNFDFVLQGLFTSAAVALFGFGFYSLVEFFKYGEVDRPRKDTKQNKEDQ